MKLLRWKAIVPLCLLLALLAAVWLLLLDGLVRRTVEFAGTQITGARVDIESADVRPLAGRIVLRGIQAADPSEPMTNLFEADEIVADLRVAPLLQKKVVVDTMAVRGVRFGTSRTTSGVLPRRGRTTGAVTSRLSEWAASLAIPEFTLRGLGRAINVTDIESDSLATFRLAGSITTVADSMRWKWGEDIRALDVRAEIDSARTLLQRLKNINLLSLGIRQIREIRDGLTSARNVIRGVEQKRDGLKSLQAGIENGVRDLRKLVEGLEKARDTDYSYARGLLQIPSLEAPDIGPALFGEMAREQLQPALLTLDRLEQYTPPGLRPRPQSGPKRVRMAGTTVHFPRRRSFPTLLLEYGEFSLTLGDGQATEEYTLQVRGFTSDPEVYGRPTRFSFDRSSGSSGGRRIQATALLDHTTATLRDSLAVILSGAGMGEVTLGSLGGRLDMGRGTAGLRLVRTGEEIEVEMTWRCPDVGWESTGVKEGIEAFVWRTISALRSVEVDVRMAGNAAGWDLSVRSNVAGELARGLERQLGDEIRRAEAQVRSEVDSRIGSLVAKARSEVEAVTSEVEERLTSLQQQLDEVRTELEARIKNLTDVIPPGIITPH